MDRRGRLQTHSTPDRCRPAPPLRRRMGVPQETVVPRHLELLRNPKNRAVIPGEARTAPSPAIFTAHIAELLAIAGDLPSVSKSEQIRTQHTFTLWPGLAERLCQKQPLVWAVLI